MQTSSVIRPRHTQSAADGYTGGTAYFEWRREILGFPNDFEWYREGYVSDSWPGSLRIWEGATDEIWVSGGAPSAPDPLKTPYLLSQDGNGLTEAGFVQIDIG